MTARAVDVDNKVYVSLCANHLTADVAWFLAVQEARIAALEKRITEFEETR